MEKTQVIKILNKYFKEAEDNMNGWGLNKIEKAVCASISFTFTVN